MLNYTCLHFNDLDAFELYDILSLRQQIFVVEQKCAYQDADQIDKTCWHILGQDFDGNILAYSRLIYSEDKKDPYIKIGRVLTSSSIRRKGEGIVLLANSMEFAWELYGKINLEISAQTYLIHFYSSLGFKEHGEHYLEDAIPHVKMIYRV